MTLSAMRTRIANKLSNGQLVRPTSSQIDDAINSTIDYYQKRYFWFQEDSVDIATSARVITSGELPSDFEFQNQNALVLQKNSYFYPLSKVTSREYDLLRNDVTTSYPDKYVYRNGQIELYPTPDQSYTITLNYYKTYADLTSDGDTNDFLDNANRLVEYKTISDLLEDYKDDDSRIPLYQQKVTDEERNVFNETYNRTSTGRLTTENIAESNTTNYSRRNY